MNTATNGVRTFRQMILTSDLNDEIVVEGGSNFIDDEPDDTEEEGE